MIGDWIVPDWPAPAAVRAVSTTRLGGFSTGVWSSLNLGLRCSDDPAAVQRNRAVLRSHLPAEPCWLRQEHGVTVFRHPRTSGRQENSAEPPGVASGGAEPESNAPGFSEPRSIEPRSVEPGADAQVAWQPAQVCVVLGADCLPVLLCNEAGTAIAAAHAGWRGLAAGVLEQTVLAMGESPGRLMAWLGPAIGPSAFEVGAEVRAAFLREDERASSAFSQRGERWLLDLYAVARQRLRRAGVSAISGGNYCTYSDPGRFFSYRRDGVTGRMASLVWLDAFA